MIRRLAAHGADRATWLASWEATGREPFAHPDYVSLFASPDDEAVALVDVQAAGSVLLPLVHRPLPRELSLVRRPAPSGRSRAWTDAVSPYGYGGPFASGQVDWRKFYDDLLGWMEQEGVLTVFVRGSLDHEPELGVPPAGLRAVELAENVLVDLRRPDDEQWRHYAHKVRKNVRKAQRAGLIVRITDRFSDLEEFVEVYTGTMDRRSAGSRYYFDASFFSSVASLPGCSVVADVVDPDGRVVSAELVLVSDRQLYSYLGGTRREAFPHSPNDLLKHSLIEYGRSRGKRAFVLGGGAEPGDGIFHYKRAFDVDGVVPFRGIQLTADADAYAAATAQAHPRGNAPDVGPAAYFPAYRAG